MYVQCPECLTVYELAVGELVAARGDVRCGQCGTVFDALDTLTESLPAGGDVRLRRGAVRGAPPRLVQAVARADATSAQVGLFDGAGAPARDAAIDPATPRFARVPARGERPRNGRWALGCALLTLALVAQIGWAERARWLDDAHVRPWIDEVCLRLGCQLPLRRDEHQLQLVSRDIRPHPSVANALIISATLRNAADFAQPFPVIEITLSDLDEHRIAMRRFQPAEYIGDARALAAGLAAGANAALVFEVADPGKNAVAFEFRFD